MTTSGDTRGEFTNLLSRTHYWVAEAVWPGVPVKASRLKEAEDLIVAWSQLAESATTDSGTKYVAAVAARWFRSALELLTSPRKKSLVKAMIEDAERAQLPNPLGVPLNLLDECAVILNAIEDFEACAKVIDGLVRGPELDRPPYDFRILVIVLFAAEEVEVASRLSADTIRRALRRADSLPTDMRERLIAGLTPHLKE